MAPASNRIDYDDGGDDDYNDDAAEGNAEDDETMANAVAKLWLVLGNDSKFVSRAQAEEALWHYYYDVDKAAAYLRKKFTPKPSPSPQGMLDNFFSFWHFLFISIWVSFVLLSHSPYFDHLEGLPDYVVQANMTNKR